MATTPPPAPTPSPEQKLSNKCWGMTSAGFTLFTFSSLCQLGVVDAVGATGDAGLSSAEVAAACDCNERFVREMMLQCAASGIMSRDETTGKFFFDAVQRAVLIDPSSPHFSRNALTLVPDQVAPRMDRHKEAFRTGTGLSYDEGGEKLAEGVAEFTVQSFPAVLEYLKAHPEVLGSEEHPVVCDIGCGSGKAMIAIATAYPSAVVHGYDMSAIALARAKANVEAAGLSERIVLHDVSTGDVLPTDNSAAFIYCVDVLHDLQDGPAVVKAARAAAKPGAPFLMLEPSGEDTDAAKITNPAGSLLLGFSVYVCMSSAMSGEKREGQSEPVGTMGFTEAVARKWFLDGGWSKLESVTYLEKPLFVATA